ncbi:MAG: hypothetical protein WC511_01590 [Candidatus Pacearchaeota archaeon]
MSLEQEMKEIREHLECVPLRGLHKLVISKDTMLVEMNPDCPSCMTLMDLVLLKNLWNNTNLSQQ